MTLYLEQDNIFDSYSHEFDDPNSLSNFTQLNHSTSSSTSHFRTLSSTSIAGPSHHGHGHSQTPRASDSFPIYDPDSPFNSPIVPVKSVGRDGRLKTKLMGVGADGGFLTSPLILGKPRMGGVVGTPEIAIASPAPVHQSVADSYSGDLNDDLIVGGSGGMGIGISGLNGSLDFSNDAMDPFLQQQQNNRARARAGLRDVSISTALNATNLNAAASIERALSPPPMIPGSAPYSVEVNKRPKKNLSVRTINKAKSCSNLSPSGRHPHEPLTPVSATHSPSNFNLPGAPYNSPIDELLNGADSGAMPFSFAELYNMGLASDSTAEIDPRKSPFAFANELLGAENGNMGLGVSAPGDEFAMLHSLPTPSLAHGSGFSSPGTPFEASPELLALGYNAEGLGAQPMLHAPSMASMPSMSSVGSAMSGSSLDDAYRRAGLHPAQAQGAPQQRRSVSYSHQSHQMLDNGMNPQLLSPPQQPMQPGRQMSSQQAYGGPNAKYSYPSRLAHGHPPPRSPHNHQHQHHQQQQYPAPPMSWTTSNGSNYSQIDTSLFVPSFDGQGRGYDRNLDNFESDMYERYSQASTVVGTPHKRSRKREEDFDEDDEEEDEIERAGEEFDYVPNVTAQSPGGRPLRHSGSQKRLRTVASAPMLSPPPAATTSRRMRPGPKPKMTKSPQEAHQSVFSAILSPPPVHGFRRATSPYASDGSPLLGGASDDEGDGQSSLPKEVIQSLYRGIASHTATNGTKVPKRYVCLMEGCERTFPRKSAIESHIQTHLEDKPFVCPHADCDASFVRQHDLRRHERIHSGNKPFPCPCGKGFARGDALARHRARGICAGSLVPRRI